MSIPDIRKPRKYEARLCPIKNMLPSIFAFRVELIDHDFLMLVLLLLCLASDNVQRDLER